MSPAKQQPPGPSTFLLFQCDRCGRFTRSLALHADNGRCTPPENKEES
jgi:hypothetical protein